jgi:hypothetical protein
MEGTFVYAVITLFGFGFGMAAGVATAIMLFDWLGKRKGKNG